MFTSLLKISCTSLLVFSFETVRRHRAGCEYGVAYDAKFKCRWNYKSAYIYICSNHFFPVAQHPVCGYAIWNCKVRCSLCRLQLVWWGVHWGLRQGCAGGSLGGVRFCRFVELSRGGGSTQQPQHTEPCQCVSVQPWACHWALQGQMQPVLLCAVGLVPARLHLLLKWWSCVCSSWYWSGLEISTDNFREYRGVEYIHTIWQCLSDIDGVTLVRGAGGICQNIISDVAWGGIVWIRSIGDCWC